MNHLEVKPSRTIPNQNSQQMKDTIISNRNFSNSMFPIPSPKRREDPLTYIPAKNPQRQKETTRMTLPSKSELKTNQKYHSKSQVSLLSPTSPSTKIKLSSSYAVDRQSSHNLIYSLPPQQGLYGEPRMKPLTKKSTSGGESDKTLHLSEPQSNRHRVSNSFLDPMKPTTQVKGTDNRAKHGKHEPSLQPVKMPQLANLSPLDAIRFKAEAELNKHYPPNKPASPKATSGFGKIDLQWTKELASVTQDLHRLEASIGVDKRQSIAHFRNSASPYLESRRNSTEFDLTTESAPTSARLLPRSQDNRREGEKNAQAVRVLPPSQRASLPVLPTPTSSSSHPPPPTPEAATSPELDSKHHDLSSSSSISTASSATSLPLTPQTRPASLLPDQDSPPTFAQELAWERRQRYLLEVKLSEEKERCQRLERELAHLRRHQGHP